MAKGKKRSYKKKYKRKYKKMYKKKYRGKYKRSYRSSYTKVKGLKHKLDNSPEMKFTIRSWTTAFNVKSDTWTIIWSNNNQYDASNFMINWPTQGTQQNQFIGNQINSLYADVRFVMDIDAVNMTSGLVRLAVVRQRQSLNYNSVVNQQILPVNLCEPFNTKAWDVMYEKVIPMMNNTTGNRTPQKIYRFKIPLRETLTVMPDATFRFEYPVYIIATCGTQNGAVVYTVVCKFFYKDP